MIKAELKTSEIKKGLNAFSVVQRYHNKNKTGGNFALEIRFNEEFKRGVDMEINGCYDINGVLSLSLGGLWEHSHKIPEFKNLNELIEFLKIEIPRVQADLKFIYGGVE